MKGFLFTVHLLVMFWMATLPLSAQDKVLLMNGQEFECRILSDTTVDIVFEAANRRGKVKRYERHKSDVFSYTVGNNPEKILYARDTMFGDFYAVDEMRVYMAGQRDARENYHPRGTFWVGFALCGTIAFLGQDGFLTAMAPAGIYTLVQFIPRLKIREKTMSDPKYKYNDLYADGYEPPARSKKVLRAMGGGYSGAALGVTLWFLVGRP